ncbi:DUF3050 domain-containing protein [Candidatus Woesearchaeota archaeon]|nr:DUF3050 domain-containing protein [Candidatus Woesearchaeota archaeon]
MAQLNFPTNFKNSKKYNKLVNLVDSITNHESMLVKEKHVLDNMIRASLLFTVCFYGNTLSLLHLALGRLKERNSLAVQKDNEFIHLFLDLADGEIATKNIKTKEDTYSPHYVSMLEAAQDAKIDIKEIENFVSKINNDNLKKITREFSDPVVNYLAYSEKCTQTFNGAFATVALRELTLSLNFKIIHDHLPKSKQYQKYKVFLSKHIDLDETEHSVLMKKALSQVENVDELINIMLTFYELRRKVYDACLLKNNIY